jgi:hypothetical protein
MAMLKNIFLVICGTLLLFTYTACERQGPVEKAGEKVDETVEETREGLEEGGEKVQEKIDEMNDNKSQN